jgi:hypothetical protein
MIPAALKTGDARPASPVFFIPAKLLDHFCLESDIMTENC